MNTHHANDLETGAADRQILDEALDWSIRLDEPPQSACNPFPDTAACNRAFFKWLEQSDHHLRIFLEVLEIEGAVRDLDEQSIARIRHMTDLHLANTRRKLATEVCAAESPSDAGVMSTRVRWAWIIALGGPVAAVVLVLFATSRLPVSTHSPKPAVYATDIGQQRTETLSDGTSITLNTDSQVQVYYSNNARNVHLTRGETYFKVTHDPRRPFTVTARDAYIRDVGTEFSVQESAAGVNVTVASGQVQAGAGLTKDEPAGNGVSARGTVLSAGEMATISSGKVQRISGRNVADALAWTEGRLVFSEDRLDFVAEQFNRYNPAHRLRVEGPVAKATLVTGGYNFHRYDEILRFARAKSHLVVIQDGNDWVIKSKK